MTSGPSPAQLAARSAALGGACRDLGIDALVVSHLPNIAYLTGLRASAALALATPERTWLISDGRYAVELADRASEVEGLDARLVPSDGTYESVLAAVVAEAGARRVGIESATVTLGRFRWLERHLGPVVTLVETTDVVERLRAVKDAWEIATLREAAGRLSEAAKCILSNALAGMVEREVAALVWRELDRVGFEKPAFDTIVASGPNAALPHYRAGWRRIEDGDLVVLDFGGIWQGYAVDLSRTVAVGAVPARHRGWLDAVAAAEDAAIAAVGPGVAPEDVDAAARGSLARAGLAEYFTHGTGHGLGLDVHERPRVGRRRAEAPEPPLEAGMVLTVEPGVYVAGAGGVRIEDDVLVTPGGREVLTTAPRMV